MSQDVKISYWFVASVALLTMVGPFSIDTYLPSFPSIETDFAISRVLILQSISFYLVANAVATLFWGPLSDRIGRRKVILGATFCYLLASLGCALATDYSHFLLYRILQGVAASGSMVAGRAMVRDSHDSHVAHRVMAYIMMLFAMAPAIAPIIGAWLHDAFGWRSVFYFLTTYAAIILLLAIYILQESLPQERRQSFHPVHVSLVYLRALLHMRFLFLVLAVGLCFGGLFLYIAGSPTVVFKFLHLNADDFYIQFVPLTLGIISGSFVSGKLAQHWSSQKIIHLAFAIMLTAGLLNVAQAGWFAATNFSVIAPQVLYAFGIALALPGFGILALDCFPHNRGAASAVQAFVQVLFAGLISGVMLPLLPVTVRGFATGQLLLVTGALILWGLIMLRDRVKRTAPETT